MVSKDLQIELHAQFQWKGLYILEHLNQGYHTQRLSQCMRFPTMWYVRPAQPQISLRIHAVWSEPLLVPWIFYECKAIDWTPFGVSKLKRRLQRLVRVYTCQNVTLLEITSHGPAYNSFNFCDRSKLFAVLNLPVNCLLGSWYCYLKYASKFIKWKY